MALRQRFHSTVSPESKQVRARFMAAMRAGSSIADATDYGNGKIDSIKKPPVKSDEVLPQPAPPKPEPVKGEFRKRGTISFEPKPEPVAEQTPEVAVEPETVVEAAPAPEAPPVKAAPVLPPDWDRSTFPWQQLRALATEMGCSANGRADAVASIKAKLIADAKPQTPTEAPAAVDQSVAQS